MDLITDEGWAAFLAATEGHTPEPWRAGRADMATIVDGYDSKWIYAGNKYVAIASSQDIKCWKTVMANAYLIEGAPAMRTEIARLRARVAMLEEARP